MTEHYRVQFEEMQFVCNESYSPSPLITEADGNLLIGVFENLISNAFKIWNTEKANRYFRFLGKRENCGRGGQLRERQYEPLICHIFSKGSIKQINLEACMLKVPV